MKLKEFGVPGVPLRYANVRNKTRERSLTTTLCGCRLFMTIFGCNQPSQIFCTLTNKNQTSSRITLNCDFWGFQPTIGVFIVMLHNSVVTVQNFLYNFCIFASAPENTFYKQLRVITRMHYSSMGGGSLRGSLNRGLCPGWFRCPLDLCPEDCLCLGRGLCPGGLPDRDTPPVNRITDRCKNITFPQLRLRALIISCHFSVSEKVACYFDLGWYE